MANSNTANIGSEKQIWDAACVLRGNMDASEYKNVVLGLIFLKYISDRFEEKHQALLDEGDGFEEDRDEYTSEGIFLCLPGHGGARLPPRPTPQKSARRSTTPCAPSRRKTSGSRIFCPRILPGRNWTSAAWATWWICSPISK